MKVESKAYPKTGGETFVRTNLGEETSLVISFFFFFFFLCAVFHPEIFLFCPQFCQNWAPYPQFGGILGITLLYIIL